MAWNRRYEAPYDPIAPGGLIAEQAALAYARRGVWTEQIRDLAQRYYRGRIPDHVKVRAAELERTRPWEVPDPPPRPPGYCVSIVGRNFIICLWQEPQQEPPHDLDGTARTETRD